MHACGSGTALREVPTGLVCGIPVVGAILNILRVMGCLEGCV